MSCISHRRDIFYICAGLCSKGMETALDFPPGIRMKSPFKAVTSHICGVPIWLVFLASHHWVVCQ